MRRFQGDVLEILCDNFYIFLWEVTQDKRDLKEMRRWARKSKNPFVCAKHLLKVAACTRKPEDVAAAIRKIFATRSITQDLGERLLESCIHIFLECGTGFKNENERTDKAPWSDIEKQKFFNSIRAFNPELAADLEKNLRGAIAMIHSRHGASTSDPSKN